MNIIFKTSLLIGFGGFLGTITRYLLSVLINKYSFTSFPLGTLMINLLGCLMIGLISGYFSERLNDQSQVYFFLTIGCLGGFTTFSAVALESQIFIQNGEILKLLMYLTFQTVIGVGLCLLGYHLMKS
jgi:CrcB protein